MAKNNQIMYSIWSENDKKSYGEFLNKECALRYMGTLILRLSSKEYSKYLFENKGRLTEEDYYYYAKIYIEDYYIDNIVLKRKIWNDQIQGFIDFDDEYTFDISEHIDRSELVKILVKKAIEIIGQPIVKK